MFDHVLKHLRLLEMPGFALIFVVKYVQMLRWVLPREAPAMWLLRLTKTANMRQENNRQLCSVCAFLYPRPLKVSLLGTNEKLGECVCVCLYYHICIYVYTYTHITHIYVRGNLVAALLLQ